MLYRGVLFIALLSPLASAKPVTVLLHGPDSTDATYYQTKTARSSSRSMQRQVFETGSRDWPAGVPAALRDAVAATQPGESLIVDLSGQMDAEQVKTWLREVPQDRQLKIISNIDKGGEIHELAMERSNTCSIARTDRNHPVSAVTFTRGQSEVYGQRVWTALSELKPEAEDNLRRNLLNGHANGMGFDPMNFARGQSSAFAYVDKVMNRGAYASPGNEDPRPNLINEMEARMEMAQAQPRPVDLSQLAKSCHYAETKVQLLKDWDKAYYMMNAVKGPEEVQPAELRPFYRYLLAVRIVRRKGKETWEEDIDKKIAKYKVLEEQFNAAPERKKPALAKKMLDVEMEVGYNLQRVLGQLHLMRQIDRTQEFWKIATPEQKQKFVSLLQCEISPL